MVCSLDQIWNWKMHMSEVFLAFGCDLCLSEIHLYCRCFKTVNATINVEQGVGSEHMGHIYNRYSVQIVKPY